MRESRKWTALYTLLVSPDLGGVRVIAREGDTVGYAIRRKREVATLVFVARGLRNFPVEYLELAKLADPRAWLAASAGG